MSEEKEKEIRREKFWKTIHEKIKYFMTDISLIRTGQLHIDIDDYTREGKLIEEFELKLVDHALEEEKVFYVSELIFKSFYNNDHDLEGMEIEDYYYVNLMPLFEKLAEISSGGKISLKWVLSLNHIKESRLS